MSFLKEASTYKAVLQKKKKQKNTKWYNGIKTAEIIVNRGGPGFLILTKAYLKLVFDRYLEAWVSRELPPFPDKNALLCLNCLN